MILFNLLEGLVSTDKALTLFLNGLHAPYWDQFMYLFSSRWTWIPLYLVMLFVIYRKEKIYFYIPFILLLVTIALNDQITSSVIKPLVERLRPCHDPSILQSIHTVNDYRAGGFSFVSGHSSNTAALVMILTLLYRNRRLGWMLLSWTLITGYSRIYLGVHFLGDVLTGFVVGTLVATIVYLAARFMKFTPSNSEFKEKPILYVYLATVAVIAVWSLFLL